MNVDSRGPLEELLAESLAREASLKDLVLKAAVSIAKNRYGSSMSPVRVEIGGYIFRVIGNSAELVS